MQGALPNDIIVERVGTFHTFTPHALKEERTMLVLSRRLGQRFQVGPDVRVTIVKIDRNSVRIGIEAPGDVTVYREEIAPQDEERPVKAGAA
jgi:carbon storage regulator